MTALAIDLAERGLVPLPGLRLGVRRLLAQRLLDAADGPSIEDFCAELADSAVALVTREGKRTALRATA